MSKKLTTEEFIHNANLAHGNKYNYSKSIYQNNRSKIIIICPIHGSFFQSSMHHLRDHGCPLCKSSKGELKVENWLKNNKIQYFRQKWFGDCKNERPLKFDFYIPTKNLLIEYDGHQHFEIGKVGKYFMTSKDFFKIQKNDQIKNNYAKNKGIKLLRIPYTKINEIDKILLKSV